jgi:hypothetical protein
MAIIVKHYTVKPLSILPMSIIIPRQSFIFMVPKNLKHKQVTTTSDTLFLGLLFYHIISAVILVMTQSLPGTIAPEKM